MPLPPPRPTTRPWLLWCWWGPGGYLVGMRGGIYDPHRGVTDRLAESPVFFFDVYYPQSGVMWGCCHQGPALAVFAFLLDPTAYVPSFL
jgi:hypothetical protein